MPELHPAEHRGHRELYALARLLAQRWTALAARLGPGDAGDALRAGADDARALLQALGPVTARYDLHGRPAAQGLGQWLAGAQSTVADRFLERNQALRRAVGDAQQVVTLLGYLAAVADTRSDDDLAAFCRRFERRLRRAENALRRAAVAVGEDPDAAIEPLDSSALGRAAHGAAYAGGTLGEWLDRRVARRR